MNKILFSFLLALFIAHPASSELLTNPYDTRHGFVINLPGGWEEAPEDAMKLLSRYSYGFQENTGQSWFTTYPYILIQVNDSKRIRESNLKNTDRLTLEFEREIEHTIYEKNIPVLEHHIDDVYYDADRKALFSTLVMVQDDDNAFQVFSAMVLTQKGYINFLYFLEDSDDADQQFMLFKDIIENVELDEDMVFTSRMSDYFMGLSQWGKKFLSSPANGFIVLFVCLVIWWSRGHLFGIK